jgi:hypothetical protein
MEVSYQSSRTIRIATALFFFVCVPLSLWETRVQSKIFVPQDAVATAQNLLAHEFIFRTTLISHIIGTVVFILMVMLFYRIFRPVDNHLAKLMIIPILLQFPIVFILEAVNFTALMTLKSDARSTFDVLQQQEVAYFLLRLHRYTFGADKLVFGLGFIPLGLLVIRSGIAPRIIGLLILIGGVGYVMDTILYMLLQRVTYLTVQPLKLISSVLYSLGFLWFLVKGARHTN